MERFAWRWCQLAVILAMAIGQLISVVHARETRQADALRALRARRQRDPLFPSELAGKCVTSPVSGREICYPDLSILDYSCVKKFGDKKKTVPPPLIRHGQYKALITKFRPGETRRDNVTSNSAKPFLVVQYQCNPGHEFLDEAEFLFCRDYHWIQTVPVCVPSSLVDTIRQKGNPCQIDNGGCSHLCHDLGGGVIRCECPSGMILDPVDYRTCKEDDPCLVGNGGCSHICQAPAEAGLPPVCSCPENFILGSDKKTCFETKDWIVKPMDCPQVPFGHPTCVSECVHDDDCEGDKKCCSNGCAYICLSPDLVERSLPDVSINPPGPLEVRPGGQVNLTCTGTGFPLPSLTWYQNERRMAQKESGLGRADPSLTASKTIFIKELFTTSTFRCEAVNDFGWKSVETKVTVLGPGSMPQAIRHRVRATNITLTWKPPVFPNGPITGYKIYYTSGDPRRPLAGWQSTEVGNVERTVISGLDPLTRYYFRMQALNEKGPGVLSLTFHIRTGDREVAPEVAIEGFGAPYGRVELEPLASVNLTCRATAGHPPPALAWYREGGVPISEPSDKSPTVDLKLTHVMESTRFECIATNKAGSANGSVDVVVTGPGTPPQQIQYRVVDGTNVDLSWGAPSIKNGRIIGYVVFYTTDNTDAPVNEWEAEVVAGAQSTVLRNLRPNSTYHVRIHAFNDLGHGPASPAVLIDIGAPWALPHVVVEPRPTAPVEPGSKLNITCRATGVPPPSITWKKGGEEIVSTPISFGSGEGVAKVLTIERIFETSQFTCEATNSAGTMVSDLEVVVRGPGSPPENVQATADRQTIAVTWEDPEYPNGEIRGYNLYFIESANDTQPIHHWTRVSIEDGQKFEWKLTNLKFHTPYSVRVSAFTRDIDGHPMEGVLSEKVYATTSRDGEPPTIILSPSAPLIQILPGGKINVTCTGVGLPEPHVRWYKNGKLMGKEVNPDLPPGEVLSSVDLVIARVHETSSFECRAANPLGTAAAGVRVDVLGPGSPPRDIYPIIYSNTIDIQWQEPALKNGQITGYEVLYTSDPKLDIKNWTTAFVPGAVDHHKLTDLLPNANYTYMVRAFNQHGPGPWSIRHTVTTGALESKPRVTITPQRDVLRVKVGDTVNLTCVAEGFPPPTVTWHMETIAQDPRFVPESQEVSLTFDNVRESFSVDCIGMNPLGEDRKTIRVEVSGLGAAPTKLEGVSKGTTAHLRWEAPEVVEADIKYFLLYYTHHPEIPDERWHIASVPLRLPGEPAHYYWEIPDLKPDTEYLFKARAYTAEGPGPFSDVVTLNTTEKWFLHMDVHPDTTAEVPVGGGIDLLCTAKGVPPPLVTWKINGKVIAEPRPYVSILKLDPVNDITSVTCIAENDLATLDKTVQVAPSDRWQTSSIPISWPDEDDGSTVLDWTDLLVGAVEGTLYTIYYTKDPTLPLDDWAQVQTAFPLNMRLPNITEDQVYYIRVRIAPRDREWSVITAPTQLITPKFPSNVTIVVEDDMTKLEWDEVKIPHSTISGYTIYYTDDQRRQLKEWFTEEVQDGPVNKAALPNVHPDTPYYVKIVIHTDKRERLPTATYKTRSPSFNRCEWAKCEHLCAVLEDEFDAECSCRQGFNLNDDGRTCSVPTTELPPAPVWPSPPDDVCLDEPDPGSCQERSETVWYYNSTMAKCLQFTFGGCDGNENRFTDLTLCMERCSTNPCMEQRRNTVHLPEDQRPKCEENGDFETLQIDHENGEYICVHPVTGKEITDTRLNVNSTDGRPYCKSCDLKREYYNSSTPIPGDAAPPECDEKGFYAPIQCDPISGQCWCVDQLTGKELDDTRVAAGQEPICAKAPGPKPRQWRVNTTAEKDWYYGSWKTMGNVTAKGYMVFFTTRHGDPLNKWHMITLRGVHQPVKLIRHKFFPPNVTSYWVLQPIFDEGPGEISDEYVFIPGAPPQPVDFQVDEVGAKAVTLIWSRDLNFDASSLTYTFYIKDKTTGHSHELKSSAVWDNFTLPVEPDRDYDVYATATDDTGRESPPSRTVSFRSLPEGVTDVIAPGETDGIPTSGPDHPVTATSDPVTGPPVNESGIGVDTQILPLVKNVTEAPLQSSPGVPYVTTEAIPNIHDDNVTDEDGYVVTVASGPTEASATPGGPEGPIATGITPTRTAGEDGTAATTGTPAVVRVPESRTDMISERPASPADGQSSPAIGDVTSVPYTVATSTIKEAETGVIIAVTQEQPKGTPVAQVTERPSLSPSPEQDDGKTTEPGVTDTAPGITEVPASPEVLGTRRTTGEHDEVITARTPAGESVLSTGARPEDGNSTLAPPVTEVIRVTMVDPGQPTEPGDMATATGSASEVTETPIDPPNTTKHHHHHHQSPSGKTTTRAGKVTPAPKVTTPKPTKPTATLKATATKAKPVTKPTTPPVTEPKPGKPVTPATTKMSDRPGVTATTTTKKPSPPTVTTRRTSVTTTSTTRSPKTKKCDKIDKPLDLVIILDASNSNPLVDHPLAKGALREMLDKYFVVDDDHVKVAFAQYSDLMAVEFALGQYRNKWDMLDHVVRVPYMVGSSRTEEALAAALDLIQKGGRPDDVPKMVLVITDGLWVGDASLVAWQLQESAVYVLAVGVGPKVSQEELSSIAGGHEDRVITYPTWIAAKSKLAQDVVKKTCAFLDSLDMEESAPETTETPEATSAPTFSPTLRVLNVTSTSAVVTWVVDVEWQAPAILFEIGLIDRAKGTIRRFNVSSKTKHFTIPLKPNKEYTIHLTAIGDAIGGRSPPSKSVTFVTPRAAPETTNVTIGRPATTQAVPTTTADPRLPGEVSVTDVQLGGNIWWEVDDRTKNTSTWEFIIYHAEGIFLDPSLPAVTHQLVIGDGQTRQYSMADIQFPSTNYTFWIRGRNEYGDGPLSTAFIATRPWPTVGPAPGLTSAIPGAVTASTRPPAGPPATTTRGVTETSPPTEPKMTSVRQFVTVSAAPTTAPVILQVNQTSTTEVKIAWTIDGIDKLPPDWDFVIYYTGDSSLPRDSWGLRYASPEEAKGFTIGGLVPDEKYTICIRARNTYGLGPSSNCIDVFLMNIPTMPSATAASTAIGVDATSSGPAIAAGTPGAASVPGVTVTLDATVPEMDGATGELDATTGVAFKPGTTAGPILEVALTSAPEVQSQTGGPGTDFTAAVTKPSPAPSVTFKEAPRKFHLELEEVSATSAVFHWHRDHEWQPLDAKYTFVLTDDSAGKTIRIKVPSAGDRHTLSVKPGRTYTVYAISESASKNIKQSSISVTFITPTAPGGEISNATLVTETSTLETVAGFQPVITEIDQISNTSIKIRWAMEDLEAVPYGWYFIIYHSSDITLPKDLWTKTNATPGDAETGAIIGDLAPGEHYHICIQIRNATAVGSMSECVAIRLTTLKTPEATTSSPTTKRREYATVVSVIVQTPEAHTARSLVSEPGVTGGMTGLTTELAPYIFKMEIEAITPFTVAVRWDRDGDFLPPGTLYTFTLINNATRKPVLLKSSSTWDRHVFAIRPNTTYTLSAVASNKETGLTQTSNTLVIKTPIGPIRPTVAPIDPVSAPIPAGVNFDMLPIITDIEQISETSIRIRWSSETPAAIPSDWHFILYYSSDPSLPRDQWSKVNATVDDIRVGKVIDGLRSEESYEICIRLQSDTYSGPISSCVPVYLMSFSTPAIAPWPNTTKLPKPHRSTTTKSATKPTPWLPPGASTIPPEDFETPTVIRPNITASSRPRTTPPPAKTPRPRLPFGNATSTSKPADASRTTAARRTAPPAPAKTTKPAKTTTPKQTKTTKPTPKPKTTKPPKAPPATKSTKPTKLTTPTPKPKVTTSKQALPGVTTPRSAKITPTAKPTKTPPSKLTPRITPPPGITLLTPTEPEAKQTTTSATSLEEPLGGTVQPGLPASTQAPGSVTEGTFAPGGPTRPGLTSLRPGSDGATGQDESGGITEGAGQTGITGSTTPVPAVWTSPAAAATTTPAYKDFTLSIPPEHVSMVPGCNCTCVIVVEDGRRRCYFDNDTARPEPAISVHRKPNGQIVVKVGDKEYEAGKGKDCDEDKGNELPPGAAQEQDYAFDSTTPVPSEQDAGCPCVQPLRGDQCPPGYRLWKGRCRDINECEYKNGDCSHGCVNTPGGFYCACPPGLLRDPNDPFKCVSQEAMLKRMAQMMYLQMWQNGRRQPGATVKPVANFDAAVEEIKQRQPAETPGTGHAKAVLSNGTDSFSLQWQWSELLKKWRLRR